MKKSLLDMSILIAFLRGEKAVISKIEEYLEEFDKLSVSIITYYELIRGLKYLGNKEKLEAFEKLMDECEIIPIDRKIIQKVSEIYAELKREGRLIEDADILIAATCIVRKLTLVTDNEKHFRRLKDLEIENWLK